MVNKIIKHFNKEAGNKMERNKRRNKVESLFDKIEDLRNIESRLITERIIRIERINFEIEETKKEIVKAEIQLAHYKYKNDKNPEGSYYMVNKIIKHFNKEIGNKMERNKRKNKVESLFDKIEELRNIESRLINERIIRIERINFEIEETKKEIVKAEEELKLKLNELSYDLEPGIKSNAKDLSFEMKGVEKIK